MLSSGMNPCFTAWAADLSLCGLHPKWEDKRLNWKKSSLGKKHLQKTELKGYLKWTVGLGREGCSKSSSKESNE